MAAIKLNAEMENGASVADWLGTAASVARVAASLLEDVRQEKSILPYTDLQRAQKYLDQAYDEVFAVRREVERLAQVAIDRTAS